MLPSDIYSQPSADDPVLDVGTVLNIARRHVSSCTAVTGINESDGEARVYNIHDDIIVKVQRPHQLRARTSLKKEAFFLDQLAASRRSWYHECWVTVDRISLNTP